MARHLLENSSSLRQILGQNSFLTSYLFVALGSDIKKFLAQRKKLGYSLAGILRSLLLIKTAMVLRETTKYLTQIGYFLWSFRPR